MLFWGATAASVFNCVLAVQNFDRKSDVIVEESTSTKKYSCDLALFLWNLLSSAFGELKQEDNQIRTV